jgi:membrane-associated phospholipid phosphatase
MLRAWVCAAALAVAFGGTARTAHALETHPLSEVRSPNYYYLHGGLTLGAAAGIGVVELVLPRLGPGYDLKSFGPDNAVRVNFSDASAHLSDKLLLVTMTAPLFLQMSQGFNSSMGNAGLIYAQSHAFSMLLADTTKLIVRRPRPYTHSKDPRILYFAEQQSADAHASFYSAHSSSAFTSAMAGSLLYAARTDDLPARHVVWGLEFLMAGMTAQLRVRAGRHYRTDIWVGTALGLSMGLAVPALHGVDLRRVRGSEMATAGGAFAVSMLLSEAVDFCGVLQRLHLCNLPHDTTVPLGGGEAASADWVVLPAPIPGGAGLSLLGQL